MDIFSGIAVLLSIVTGTGLVFGFFSAQLELRQMSLLMGIWLAALVAAGVYIHRSVDADMRIISQLFDGLLSATCVFILLVLGVSRFVK